MNKRIALTTYLALWVVLSAGVIYGVIRAGYPLWAALASAYLLFVFLNGSLAYLIRARLLRLEGKKAPPYLKYIFFPKGIPKFKEEAPRSAHVFAGVTVSLAGAFFVFCGVALSFDAEWSRISQPFIVAAVCLGFTCIGALFLYLAWRIFSYRGIPNDAA